MMNLRSVVRHAQANILAGNAVIIKGPPGFAKTEAAKGLARWWRNHLGPTKRVGMSRFFMATQTPIGFTGLPWKGELVIKDKTYTVTQPAIPAWFLATCLDTGEVLPADQFDSVFLVIEEWGQGGPETKRAGAEVMLAGGTPPYYLPPGSPRVALSNVDASDGITKEYDFIIGRRAELEVSGDVDVWLEDFADKPYQWQGKTWNVLPLTKFWAKTNPGVLFEPKPAKQGPWCNPRTLTAADRYVQVLAELNGGEIPIADPGFTTGLAGHIGMGAAVSYVGNAQFQLELPHYEDVVKDPEGTPVPSKADLQMLMAYELAGRTKVDDLASVIQYMTKDGKPRMPQDMMIAFVSSILRRDYKSFLDAAPMKALISKHQNLIGIIASLS